MEPSEITLPDNLFPDDTARWQAEVRTRMMERDALALAANVRRDERMTAHEQNMADMQAKLDTNAAAIDRVEASTGGIVDMMQSWTGAMKTIEAVGKALRPITYIVGFVTAMIALLAAVLHFDTDN